MNLYKDIINFSMIRRLKERLTNICILYNNLVNTYNIKKRESEYYEVYTEQYLNDINKLAELRDNCLHTADLCNEIMLMANRHHIKQYYIDKEIVNQYEFAEDYINESNKIDESNNKTEEVSESNNIENKSQQHIVDEEDFW